MHDRGFAGVEIRWGPCKVGYWSQMNRCVWAGQWTEHRPTWKMIQQNYRRSQHTSADQIPILVHSFRVTWIKTKREDVKCILKPNKLNLIYKANKRSRARAGDFCMLPTHEPSVL